MANEKRLIDANALIEALPIVTEDKKITLYGAVADFMIMILAMPTVEAVEVVHGRWVHPKGYVVSNGFKCSVCGHEEKSYYPIHPRRGACVADENGNFFYPPKINYCPNCGAKMDADGND